LCFTLALTFYPLPSAFAFGSGAIASKRSEDGQERKWLVDVSGLAANRPANPVARIFKKPANDSPSPWGEGRDEGGREPFEIRIPHG
jgi:hypothetical protein